MTESDGRKGHVFECDSFDVGDHIELVVVVSGEGNVLDSEAERDKDENCPDHFE